LTAAHKHTLPPHTPPQTPGPGDRQSPGGGIYKLASTVISYQSLREHPRVYMAYYQNPVPPVPQPQPVYWQQLQQQLLPTQYQYQPVQQYQPIYQLPQTSRWWHRLLPCLRATPHRLSRKLRRLGNRGCPRHRPRHSRLSRTPPLRALQWQGLRSKERLMLRSLRSPP
jgi:hypothetical protein